MTMVVVVAVMLMTMTVMDSNDHDGDNDNDGNSDDCISQNPTQAPQSTKDVCTAKPSAINTAARLVTLIKTHRCSFSW